MTNYEQVKDLAKNHPAAKIKWKERGTAPIGYTKGMAVAWADVLKAYRADHPVMIEVAKGTDGQGADDAKDALSWLTSIFIIKGLGRHEEDGETALRHTFVLLWGLGMRESSGKYCEGRDTTARIPPSSDTVEAGLFQMSWDLNTAHSLIREIFEEYQDESLNSVAYTDIFKEGVTCKASSWENVGKGEGRLFQELAKKFPLFSVKVALVGLRNRRKHWGPINRREVEIRKEVDDLLKQIAEIVT